MRSLFQTLEAVGRGAADRVAIADAAGATSYARLLDWSGLLARTIEPLLRAPGQRIAVVLDNSAEFAAAFVATARVGAVVAPLNPQCRPGELTRHLRALDAGVVLTGSARLPGVLAAARGEIHPSVVEVRREAGGHVVQRGLADGRPVGTPDSPPLLQLPTSGSTAHPKQVVRTHAAILTELQTLHGAFAIGPEDRFLGLAPFFHVNGLVRTLLTALTAGAGVFSVDGLHRREVLELIRRERLTVLGAVPPVFGTLARTAHPPGADLSSLRLAFSASAPLMPEDQQRFLAEYGVTVRQVYGSTETGTISFNDEVGPSFRAWSVGRPLPGVSVQVLDAAGRELAPGQQGEVAVRSPFAASGYLDDAHATAESFRAGVYLTGDFGVSEPDGHLRLTGRKKWLINRGGLKVNPYEIEEVLRRHPKVRDVVVYGRPGPYGEEQVCAAVVASAACTVEEVVRHCREQLSDVKVPSVVTFLTQLPRTSTGKLLRHGDVDAAMAGRRSTDGNS